MTMDVETWLQKVAADRPALTPAQVALLRPILAPVTPRTQNAAPAATTAGTAPDLASRKDPQ